MKTKRKVNFKVLWGTIALCVAIVLSAIGLSLNRKTNTYAYTDPVFRANEEFTVVDTNGLVFNMEKVGVVWNDDDDGQQSKTKQFTTTNGEMSTLPGGGQGKEIYFKSLPTGTAKRYKVENNTFVMLNENNEKVTVGNSEQELEETILITFGQYYYENGVVKTALNGDRAENSQNTGAGIGLVSNSVITINGKTIDQKDETYGSYIYYRQYEGEHGDFAFLLPKNAEEGYYTIQLNYSFSTVTDYGGDTAKFSFYLIRESSYTAEPTEEGSDNIYTAKPTLTYGENESSHKGKELSKNGSNLYSYVLGQDKDYPTLTYDYTKYTLSYSHYANERTTNYVYNFDSVTNKLNLTISRLGQDDSTESFVLENYKADSKNHLATIVLTDYGTYTFSFGYIYRGYNWQNAPTMNLAVDGFGLEIGGMENTYARTDANVQFKYIKFANNSKLVDLIVPSGYTDKSHPQTNKINYSTNKGDTSASNDRVGNTIENDSYDTNLGQTILGKKADEWAKIFGGTQTDQTSNATDIKSFINNIDFNHLTTNLGSVKFYSNNHKINFDDHKSFYFKADDPNFVGEIFTDSQQQSLRTGAQNELNTDSSTYVLSGKIDYDETTFLNKPGYFIVFLNIDDGNGDEGRYHIFAYRYNQVAVKANLTTVDKDSEAEGEVVRADGFTSGNVKVSWQDAGVFEQDISVVYQTSTSSAIDVADPDDYVYGESQPLTNGQTLGDEIENTYLHYRVVVNCPGISNETYTFTIDRSPITNVALYETELTTNQFGAQVYQYRYYNNDRVKLDTNNSYAITSDRFAIDWDKKASGASVSAEYLFVPFTQVESGSAQEITVGNNQLWITNGMEADLSEIQTHVFENSQNSLKLVQNQGIYLFVITDQAGNSTRYMYVLDNSLAYFKVGENAGDPKNETFFTNEMRTYSGDVDITFGTHKAIKIENASSSEETGEKQIFKQLVTGNFNDNEKYFNATNNLQKVTSLFSANGGSDRYLIVPNTSLTSYNYVTSALDSSLSVEQIDYNNSSKTMTYDSNSASTSMIRIFYLQGENNKNYQAKNSASYIIVEINKDNSRGEVYYFNSAQEIKDETTYDNLFKDKQLTNRLFTSTGIGEAEATRDNYVYFVWNKGENETEVKSISYKRYNLNLNKIQTEGQDTADNLYYYEKIGDEVSVYKDGTYSTNAGSFDNGQRGYALLGLSNGSSAEGLYVVTRTYKDNDAAFTNGDQKTLQYYFIVDRNGIMSGEIGKGINFGLFDGQVKYNNFNITTQNGTLTYTEGEGLGATSQTINYPIYLNTDSTLRLPATINVPTQKYYKDGVNADYLANSLYISVWFKDVYKQLPNQTENTQAIKLFEYVKGTDTKYTGNQYIKLDLKQNTKLGDAIFNRFVRTDGHNEWLTLPGDYVVIITDAIKSTQGGNRQVLGFKISMPNEKSGPKANVSANNDGNTEYTNNASWNDALTWQTNKDTITITIPKAHIIGNDKNTTTAQTEPEYFVIKQTISGRNMADQVRTYSYIYGAASGDSSFVKINNDGDNMVVTLTSGNATINQKITYQITLRWESAEIDNAKNVFANSYYYYDSKGNIHSYFEKTYTIVVDRLSPDANITYLQNNDDGILQQPFNRFYADNLFADSIVGGNHVTTYAEYGKNDISKIYAFSVTDSTQYSAEDIANVYVKSLDDTFTLGNLEYSNFVGYRKIDTIPTNFGRLFAAAGATQAGYYEIVEQDFAGNLTQYVVLYNGNDKTLYNNLNLTLTFKTLDDPDTASDHTFENGETVNAVESIVAPSEVFKLGESPLSNVYDRFYHFELARLDSNGNAIVGQTKSINTNLSTQFTNSGLAQELINLFKQNGSFVYGNYRLTLYTRSATKVFYINFYEKGDYKINARDLVTSSYDIDFSKAIGVDNGVTYHAKSIRLVGGDDKINERYEFNERDYAFHRLDDDGKQVENPTHWITDLSGTYLIITEIGNTKSSYRFDTNNQTEFDRVVFAGGNYHDQASDVYYTFNRATIYYNTTFYDIENISYSIFGSELSAGEIGQPKEVRYQGETYTLTYDDDGTILTITCTNNGTSFTILSANKTTGQIEIFPYFENHVGAKLEVVCQLKYTEQGDEDVAPNPYHIVIDTRTANAELLNAEGQLSNIMGFAANQDDITSTDYGGVGQGERFLTYRKITSDSEIEYSYNYQMFVEEINGSLTEIFKESDNDRFHIVPSEDNRGIYYFVISVSLVANGQTISLGNVVYTFMLEEDKNVFTPFVVEIDNERVQPNSFVTIGDMKGDSSLNLTNDGEIKEAIVLTSNTNGASISSDDINLPADDAKIQLFVSNQEIEVHPYDEYTAYGNYTNSFDGYTFTLYRLLKDGVEYYIATLVVPVNRQFVSSNVTVNSGTYIHQNTWIGESFEIKYLSSTYNKDTIIKNKNQTYVSVYFYNQLVYTKAVEFDETGSATSVIKGNGEYSLRFTDLGGNTNQFTFGSGNPIETEQISLTTLNNAVAILVNEQAPINKAFYNGEVTISVQSLSSYGANRNDIVYKYRYNSASAAEQTIDDLSSRRFSYTFTKPGWYSLQIVCPRQEGGDLVSNLEFTIIEPSEAHTTFSFGSARTEQIVSVTNRANMTETEIVSLTNAFKNMLKENEYNLNYKDIVSAKYANALGIANTYGRQTFNITYRVDEGIYPARQVSFTLSLNDSQPNINCSLNAGEGNTKGFTISYNLGEIYNQIGSSTIYVYKGAINDNSVLLSIDANQDSANEIASSRVARSGTESDGNYYIVLKTSSGRIVSSYGVKITQPLNTWAIVVIVVVTVLVLAVVITIIVLRTKMRIR